MDTQRGPARLVPPGRIIGRELEARGWQQRDLAEIMGRPEQAISEIINGKKAITPDTARELASAFGTSVDFWINLETNYRLHLAEHQERENTIRRRARLYEKAPYREIVKRGWIEDKGTLEEKEQELCCFLEIPSLDDEPHLAMSARHSAHKGSEQVAEMAWAKRVEHLARQQALPAFERVALIASMPTLLAYAMQPEDATNVPAHLSSLGVHFVVVPHLPQTYLDGAALYVGAQPVVALTLRYDRLDNFWFTLLHELAHITLGHEGAFLDRLDAERTMTAEEEEADAQARDWLIEPQAYQSFAQKGQFGPLSVKAFALQQKRHPSIIAGRLQHDNPTLYKRFTTFRVSVKDSLSGWIENPPSMA